MSRDETRQEQIERLATRIAAGDVVFFIGAGFSLDSEKNSAKMLIVRLLARFEAFTEYMSSLPEPQWRNTVIAAQRLRKGLRTTFLLKKTPVQDEVGDIFTDKDSFDSNLTALSQNYYLINDWMCSAFEGLIDHLAERAIPSDLAVHVNTRENDLLGRHGYATTFELPKMDIDWLINLHRFCKRSRNDHTERTVAGKALFLDTLGFRNEEVMAGRPMDVDLREALTRSQDRLRDRHRVLAWLAAEGLCPTLVTTNYDLLIESAYRVCGLLPLNPPYDIWKNSKTPIEKAESERLPVNSRYRHYKRVANAAQFFTHGDARQSALIHKIHGCVESYRIVLDRKDTEGDKTFQQFRAVLPTIVFTFREIQNWRDDSWSRDYLSTLLRTHTIVFAGYSGADPVIHDTFRTVYEDMGRQQARISVAKINASTSGEENQTQRRKPRPGEKARAFFMDLEQKREFHGLELLRAASTASEEVPGELTDHPNLLTFRSSDEKVFPNLDEVFLWLYHVTAREVQWQALNEELRRIRYQLFGGPCPEDEATAILDAFTMLRNAESLQARAWDCALDADHLQKKDLERVRWIFRRMTAWTSGFHRLLMREYELASGLQKHPTEREKLLGIMEFPWYRPMSEHPQWTAWGAVLELAMRRAVAAYVNRPDAWTQSTTDFEVAEHSSPMIVFRTMPWSTGDARPAARRCITLELAAARRLLKRQMPQRSFTALRPLAWSLQPETVPWWAESDARRPDRTPSAAQIWKWAAFPPQNEGDTLKQFFGW